MDIQQEEKENMEKSNSLLILAGAAAFFLLGGADAVFGGVEGGNGKKATAITGITPPNDGGGSTTPTNPTTPTTPTNPPPSYNTTIPNYGNITTPFEPSPYLLGLINQKYADQKNTAMAIDQLKNTGLSDIKYIGTDKYTGTRNGYFIEGDLTSKKLQIDPITQQAYTHDTGGIGPEVLYTEKSKKQQPVNNIVGVPYLGFGIGGFGYNTNNGFIPINTATKKENSSGSFSVSSGGENKPSAGTTVFLSPGQDLSNFKPPTSSSSSKKSSGGSSSSNTSRAGGESGGSYGGWGG